MRFTKMHGAGNDYVYIDVVTRPELEHAHEWPVLTRRMSDRHTGVGSDGVILICRPTASGGAGGAHVRMRMFNADGSESEMCGNGVRCVGRFAVERLGLPRSLRVETERGVLTVECGRDERGEFFGTVDMGSPVTDPAAVPVDLAACEEAGPHVWRLRGQTTWPYTFVSMGNPHAVSFFERGSPDPMRGALNVLGPTLERHAAFPKRANIHWAWCTGRREVTMLTWERGAGMTQACGTGACAVLVAGVLTGRLERAATINVPGGVLRGEWPEGGSGGVLLSGPAQFVFDGEWVEEGERRT